MRRCSAIKDAVDRLHRGRARRVLVVLIPVMLSALVASPSTLAIAQDRAVDEAAGPVLSVNTIVARTETSVRQTRSFSGIVAARRSSDLSFERPGRIAAVLIAEGDRVEAGQLLAQLDQRLLEKKKAALDEALERAQADLAALDPESPQATPAQLQATLQQLRAELDQLQREIAALASTGGVASNTQSIGQRLSRAEAQLARADVGSRRQRIESLSKQIAELEGQRDDLNQQLEASELKAPFGGVVARRYTAAGEVVSPSRPVARIVQLDALQVRVGIPLDVASQASLGQELVVSIGAQQFSGVVKAKSPEVDRSTRTRTVLIELGGAASEQVLPGEVARVVLDFETDLSGIWVPLSALNRAIRGLWTVLVVEGAADQQVVGRRIVELIHLENDRALVRGALDDGEAIVRDGVHRLVPGQRVKPIDAAIGAETDGTGSGPRR